MKIALLVSHIICAILLGICAVIHTNMIAAILYMIASMLWSINVGFDITKLIYDD